MLALVAAALTFFIVFWSVWELGQPWIKFGWPQRIGEKPTSGTTINGIRVWME